MDIYVPDPVITVDVQVDSPAYARDWSRQETYVCTIEIGGVVIFSRNYHQDESPTENIYIEDVADAQKEILREFGEKMKSVFGG